MLNIMAQDISKSDSFVIMNLVRVSGQRQGDSPRSRPTLVLHFAEM